MHVVFDNKENGVSVLQIPTIVFDRGNVRLISNQTGDRKRKRRTLVVFRRCRSDRRRGRPHIGLRKIEGEGAAFARRAPQLNFAAKQARQLTADGQPQAGTAILSTGACVRLLASFEDNPLLLGRNSDAGIRYLEGDDRSRSSENLVGRSPATCDRRDRESYAALFGKFEGVRKQILQYLLQAFRVSHQTARELRIGFYLKR